MPMRRIRLRERRSTRVFFGSKRISPWLVIRLARTSAALMNSLTMVRDGDARDAELQPGDEQHVEDDIDHAADGQVIQRALGIADGAKDGRAIVIDEAGGQADGVNIEIELCAGQHVFGAAISSSSGAERSSSSARAARRKERPAPWRYAPRSARRPGSPGSGRAGRRATDAPTLRPISMLTRS